MNSYSLFRFWPRVNGYSHIRGCDRDVKLGILSPRSSEDDEPELANFSLRSQLPYHRKMPGLALFGHVIFTLINLGFFAFLIRAGSLPLTIRNFHQRAVSSPSPVFDLMDVETITKITNGSLFKEPTESLFRKLPSPEVDDAWEDISYPSSFLVDGKYIRGIAKGNETTVKAPVDWGFGDDMYPVLLSGAHELHCLNMVRKSVYSEYYYGPEGPSHPLHWVHISHCLDIVRQALMCSYSTDLITFQWVETQVWPAADFNFERKCRNADAIADWARAEEKRYNVKNRPHMKLPAGVTPVPISEEYWKYEPALIAYHEKLSGADRRSMPVH